MTDPARRNRRILITITAALAIAAIVVPLLSTLLAPRERRQAAPVPSTTGTTTAPTIKPLAVRPVRTAFVTKPELCTRNGFSLFLAISKKAFPDKKLKC